MSILIGIFNSRSGLYLESYAEGENSIEYIYREFSTMDESFD